jgi:acetyl-CoA carboxylase carboxyl transferase subunit alpha
MVQVVAVQGAAASCCRPIAASSLREQQSGLGRLNGRPQLRSARRLGLAVRAKGKAGDPPDVPKPRLDRAGGREWLQSILSRFGPVREKASNTTVLDFEKPLVELDNRIKEVRRAQVALGSPTTPAAPPPPPSRNRARRQLSLCL